VTRLRYKAKSRDKHFYIDYPRLSEPYLFKRSEEFQCNVQDVDSSWLLVHYPDQFEVVSSAPVSPLTITIEKDGQVKEIDPREIILKAKKEYAKLKSGK
jgi:hypothetical protein